ncbi:MAG: SDR family oxidoreductase [Ruminococcaceae bacterium]|nr:SDR family oxidoreductase [Oscillospiraceae bacterium]
MTNVMELFRLDGKTAVVTGGSGMYGRQLVQALAQAGAKVYTASRSLEANEEYAAKMRAEGLNVHAGKVDQGDEESIKAFLEEITKDGQKIDILINNSVLRCTKDYHGDAALFDQSMHVNATGLMMISRAFGDHMAENGGGSIINIGSYMGVLGPDYELYKGTEMSQDFAGDYFFHKGGMVNYTRFLASYYGAKNVRCNVLNLGGFFNNQPEIFVQRYSAKTFLNRMANESDIMGAIVFLASDASSYITGASIPVDGGYIAK